MTDVVDPGPVFHHVSVLLQEVLEELCLFPGARVLDCTLGGGGHSEAILKQLDGTGLVTGLDVDPVALQAAGARLAGFANFRALRVNFGRIGEDDWLEQIGPQDAILMDLGVSSPQLDVGARGFSIRRDGPLDMRMDPRLELTAREILASYSELELRRIFFEFGEEPKAGKVAWRLVQERSRKELETTAELVSVLESTLGRPRPGKVHPGTRIFQALRMEVNQELELLGSGLRAALQLLKVGGRLAVMSYHSLEDRLVKRFIQEHAGRCRCPRGAPVCMCGARAVLEPVRSKAIQASEAEIERNPRARSVRLRVARKVGEVDGR